MANIQPLIGINLLNVLMLKLYSNPRCIFREYIQNSLDSVQAAVREGILPRVNDGRVSISIGNNDIVIEDNGIGIKQNEAIKTLTDIANSAKNGIDTAGQFGVGRLSGGGYCEILEFETTYCGEEVATIVTFNMVLLRQMLENKEEDISAADAMRLICSTRTDAAERDKHGFIVRMKNVVNSQEVLLDEEEIRKYISEYAPVDYSVVFNQLINISTQEEFRQRHKAVECISVSLNGYSDVEKGYGREVKGTGDNISKIRYFKLQEHPNYGSLGWGWYAVSDFSKQINETMDSCVGIRLRKHNISLDKNILDKCFINEPRGNKYFYGEIFITNDKIVPDSGRNGLSAGEEADALMSEIQRYAKEVLRPLYHRANELKTTLTKKIKDSLEMADDPSKASVIGAIIPDLDAHIKEFKKCLGKCNTEEQKDIAAIYKKKYDDEYLERVNKYIQLNDVEDEEINITSERIFAIHKDSGGSCNSVDENNKHNQRTRVSSPNGRTSQSSLRPSRTRTEHLSLSDIEDILREKKYDAGQVEIVHKIFDTILNISSDTEKKKTMNVLERAVKNLPVNK